MVMELIREGKDKKLEEVLKKTPEAGARQDSEGNSPAQRAIQLNQEGCLLKIIKAKVKIPEVRAQVTSNGDEIEVVMDNKLKLSNLDLPTLKKLLQECEVTQVDVKNGDPSLLKPAQDGDWPRLVELLEAGVKMVRNPDGHLPISWNLDGLANHPRGESVIVGLAQAGRVDLLRTLFDQLKQLTVGHDTVGVCHQVVNKTELSVLMRSKDVEEDLKREAIGILAEEGLNNLPPSNFREGEADQLARAWNSKEGVATVTAEEQLWFRGNKIEDVTTWTDRDAEGEIIGLKIKTVKDGQITQLKTLHGSQWSNWRDVGWQPKYNPNDDDKETELILLPGERINCISTWSGSKTGSLFCIEVATTQGRQFSAGNKRGLPSHHLENEQKLVFLSGVVFNNNDQSLTFHWAEDDDL